MQHVHLKRLEISGIVFVAPRLIRLAEALHTTRILVIYNVPHLYKCRLSDDLSSSSSILQSAEQLDLKRYSLGIEYEQSTRAIGGRCHLSSGSQNDEGLEAHNFVYAAQSIHNWGRVATEPVEASCI